jgi:hypothetical protein
MTHVNFFSILDDQYYFPYESLEWSDLTVFLNDIDLKSFENGGERRRTIKDQYRFQYDRVQGEEIARHLCDVTLLILVGCDNDYDWMEAYPRWKVEDGSTPAFMRLQAGRKRFVEAPYLLNPAPIISSHITDRDTRKEFLLRMG